ELLGADAGEGTPLAVHPRHQGGTGRRDAAAGGAAATAEGTPPDGSRATNLDAGAGLLRRSGDAGGDQSLLRPADSLCAGPGRAKRRRLRLAGRPHLGLVLRLRSGLLRPGRVERLLYALWALGVGTGLVRLPGHLRPAPQPHALKYGSLAPRADSSHSSGM